jgi:hypothetical protein
MRGFDEIVLALPLTMAEEWARDHRWTDWACKACGGLGEWDSVWNQPAVEGRGGNPSFDKGHGGMKLADFRQCYVDLVAASNGDDELVPSLEEVAAMRLYTGPAHVKLNGFMGMVGTVPEKHWRARFAQLRNFTYNHTVHHLINAIRKVTQITALRQPHFLGEVILYRGVRGKLPDSFYKAKGFLTAVEFGFVSTSTDRNIPVLAMSPDESNALWVMHGSHGTDSTGQLHNGAVLEPLSQFPEEVETLLPPLCMLQVLRDDQTGKLRVHDKEGNNSAGETVVYTEIHVRPCFVS